jgi:predicted nucleic acid-binding protein
LILLDTNILSELTKPAPNEQVVAWLAQTEPALAIPTIAIAEMAYGVEKLTEGKRRERLRTALKRLAESFENRLLPFDLAASWAYGDILAVARKAGRPMSVPDAAIAAIARSNDCTLATRNIKDFETTGLDLVDPWTSAETG